MALVRRSLALLLLCTLLGTLLGTAVTAAAAGAAGAQGTDTDSSDTDGGVEVRDVDNGVSSLPRPGEGSGPERASDPGGWQQLALFTFILLGLTALGGLAARDIRQGQARLAAQGANGDSGGGLQPGAEPVDHLDRA